MVGGGMDKELTEEELELLSRIMFTAVKNDNTVCPEAFIPTPEEYKLVCRIITKMELYKNNLGGTENEIQNQE